MESGAVGICCEAVAEGMGEARGPREAREVGACIYIAPEYALSGLYLYTYRYCTPDTTAIYVGTVHRRAGVHSRLSDRRHYARTRISYI